MLTNQFGLISSYLIVKCETQLRYKHILDVTYLSSSVPTRQKEVYILRNQEMVDSLNHVQTTTLQMTELTFKQTLCR